MTVMLPEADQHFYMMGEVTERMLKGEKNTEIAKSLGITRAEVTQYLKEYRNLVANDPNTLARAKEVVHLADQHYTMLIKEWWGIANSIITGAATAQELAQKNTALKNIADTEQKRFGLLKEAGLLDALDIGEQIAESERKQEIIIKILKEELCEKCRLKVTERIAQITNKADVIVIKHDES